MSVSTIESELLKMTDPERQRVINVATRLMSGKKTKISRSTLEENRARMRKSAELMLEHYLNDKELTIWTALDGEDFLSAYRRSLVSESRPDRRSGNQKETAGGHCKR